MSALSCRRYTKISIIIIIIVDISIIFSAYPAIIYKLVRHGKAMSKRMDKKQGRSGCGGQHNKKVQGTEQTTVPTVSRSIMGFNYRLALL